MGDVPLSWRVVVSKVTAWAALQSSRWRNTRGLQTAFTADYVLGISIYIYATVRSFGPLLDTSANHGKNTKHSDYNKGTSPTTGDARPVYTTVSQCSQNVDVKGPHHRCFELIVPSSFNQPMAVERGRSHELVGSMVGAVYVHVLRILPWAAVIILAHAQFLFKFLRLWQVRLCIFFKLFAHAYRVMTERERYTNSILFLLLLGYFSLTVT